MRSFLQDVGPDVADELLAASSRRTVARTGWLFHEGEPARDAFLIDSGLLKMVTTTVDGSRALVAVRGSGEIIGELGAMEGVPRMLSAVAAVDTEVTAIPGSHLVAVLRDHPDAAMTMLSSLSGLLRNTALHVLALTSGDASALIARRLLQLVHDPTFVDLQHADGDTVVVDMPMAQSELAAWAGVSHRSASAVLQQLRDEGVISTSRLQLAVHDCEELERRTRSLPPFVGP